MQPLKIIPEMTYCVSGGILSPTHTITVEQFAERLIFSIVLSRRLCIVPHCEFRTL